MDLRDLLNKTSKITSLEQEVWYVQWEHDIVGGPNKDCLYEYNKYVKVDVNLQSIHGRQTALMKASEYGNEEIVKFLLSCGADLNIQCLSGWTALMCATEHIEVVRILLKAGANPNFKTVEGWPLLMLVSMNPDKSDLGEIAKIIKEAMKRYKMNYVY